MYKPNIDLAKLKHFAEKGLNVLFEGKHGVGKTSTIMSLFNDLGMNCQYYSASTLDPYIDFRGIPKIVDNSDGSHVLELIRQSRLEDAEVIFIDELNRSPKALRNALLEIIQFKTINGTPLPKLRMVWAAVNPEDLQETYDVEPLDPALRDRFHVCVQVPYNPCLAYFAEKYGEHNTEVACGWWKDLSNDLKDKISPRRLDEALNWYLTGGELVDILGDIPGLGILRKGLISDPISKVLFDLYDYGNGDTMSIKAWINNLLNLEAAIPHMVESPELFSLTEQLSKESLVNAISSHDCIRDYVVKNLAAVPAFMDVTKNVIQAGGDDDLIFKIKKSYLNQRNTSYGKAKGDEILDSNIKQWGPNHKYVKEQPGNKAPYFKHLYGVDVKTNELNISTPAEALSTWTFFIKFMPPKISVDECYHALRIINAVNLKAGNSGIFNDPTYPNALDALHTVESELVFQHKKLPAEIVKKVGGSSIRSLMGVSMLNYEAI